MFAETLPASAGGMGGAGVLTVPGAGVRSAAGGVILPSTMNTAKRARPENRLPGATAILLGVAILAGCASVGLPPTYTQDELKAECDRHRGWWRPDDLRGGHCDFRRP